MNADFSRTLALLRQEKEISQRKAAADLGISQALLSHYENGVREPGLAFVKKACDYYHVSADYLLGRTLDRDGGMIDSDELYDSSAMFTPWSSPRRPSTASMTALPRLARYTLSPGLSAIPRW